MATLPNQSLLIHFDGANGATTYTAETGQTVTFAGTAQITTGDGVFGGSCLLLDGDSDYVSVPDSANWAFGTGDFTVEARCKLHAYPSTNSDKYIMLQWVDVNNRFEFKMQDVSGVRYWRLFCNSGGVTQVAFSQAATVSLDTWYHIAWVRNGNNWYVFQNGIAIGTTYVSSASIPDYAAAWSIGAVAGTGVYWFNGWIDEVRVSKGVAHWTSNFTVPNLAYTNGTLSDAITISSNPNKSPAKAIPEETVTLSDAATRRYDANLLESITPSELTNSDTMHQLLEEISFVENISWWFNKELFIVEVMTVSDDYTRIWSIANKTFSESATISDNAATGLGRRLALSDGMTITDAMLAWLDSNSRGGVWLPITSTGSAWVKISTSAGSWI